jgi:predicted transcriptional regulator
MERERDHRGQYTEQVTPESVLAIFDAEEVPVLTAKDVAEELDIARQTAYNKLEELVSEGMIYKKKVGARAAVYIYLPTVDDSDS